MPDTNTPSDPETPRSLTPDLNLRLLGHLVRYVLDHYGKKGFDQVLSASGLSATALEAASSWVALEQFELVLASSRALMRDDDEFRNACAYRLSEVSGPVRLIIGALSPSDAYELGARNMRLISTISQFKPERKKPGHLEIRYESSRAESRLMCLSRQAQIRELPTLWGLPPASVSEEGCIAYGDKECGYVVRVYEHRRWLPMVMGAAAGGGLAAAVHFGLAAANPNLSWVLPALGAVAGYLLELRRSVSANRLTTAAMNTAYLDMAREDAKAKREVFDLNERQQQWTNVVEQQVAVRAHILDRFVDQLGRLVINPRGLQDEAPVAVLRSQVAALRERAGALDEASQAIIMKLDRAVERLDTAMDDLVDLAADQSNLISLLPQVLDIEPLVGELRTRLSALVHGRDVRVSVFAVREAPRQVRADVLVFNRIIDTLLTNAARATERGSIVVEVGGRPGFLSIKVSDTSRGMAQADIGRIFEERPPGRILRTNQLADLWTAANLLSQVKGKLDVTAIPGKGTTVWAHFPTDFGARASTRPAAAPRHLSDGDVETRAVPDPKGSAGTH